MSEGKESARRTDRIEVGLCVLSSSEWDRSWMPNEVELLVRNPGGGYVTVPLAFAAVAFDRPDSCQIQIELADGWKLTRP